MNVYTCNRSPKSNGATEELVTTAQFSPTKTKGKVCTKEELAQQSFEPMEKTETDETAQTKWMTNCED